jgi:F420-dependent oxidoreductase-like protein
MFSSGGFVALLRRGIHFGSYGTVDDGSSVFSRLAEAVAAAEAAGFDSVSVPDHMHQNSVGGGPSSPMFEAYTLLGALAMRTVSVRLLALVSPVTLRPPGLLAKAVTTLDVLSGGRAVLGIGAGWDAAESAAYGIPFPATGERFDRLDEALSVCRALLRSSGGAAARPASFDGGFYAVRDAYNSPRPVSGSIPVLVAGGGEKRTLDLVARYADACNVWGGELDSVRHKFAVLDSHCLRAGRDPGSVTRTVFTAVAGADLSGFEARAREFRAAGADGLIIIAPEDASLIPGLGRVLGEVFGD